LTTEWVAEIKRPRSVDELIDFLKAERVRIKKEERFVWKDDRIYLQKQDTKILTLNYQKMIVEELLDEVEDCSMEVSLERVSKLGKSFPISTTTDLQPISI